MTLSFDELGTQSSHYGKVIRSLNKKVGELESDLPKAQAKVPDALVQVTITTTCRGCGEVYSHPNRSLLLRYDRKHFRTRFWHQAYATLPREFLRIEERCSTCEGCFEKGVFLFQEEDDPEIFGKEDGE